MLLGRSASCSLYKPGCAHDPDSKVPLKYCWRSSPPPSFTGRYDDDEQEDEDQEDDDEENDDEENDDDEYYDDDQEKKDNFKDDVKDPKKNNDDHEGGNAMLTQFSQHYRYDDFALTARLAHFEVQASRGHGW